MSSVHVRAWCGLALLVFLSACAVTSNDPAVAIDDDATWVVLPFEDHSENAVAARQLQVLSETGLRARGFSNVARTGGQEPATRSHALAGKVLQWEPARIPGEPDRVSIELQVQDLNSGEVLLSRQGKARSRQQEGITSVASRLVQDLLLSLHADARPSARDVQVAGEALSLPVQSSPLTTTGSALRIADPTDEQGLQVSGASSVLGETLIESLDGRSTAFFYGADLPLSLLSQFDRVVLEPDNVTEDELEHLHKNGVATFAYVSVGEVGPDRPWQSRLQPSWTLGTNTAWNSQIMDLRAYGWRSFLTGRVDALMLAGYDGLFLDTMDSFTLIADTPEAKAEQSAGLVEIIERQIQRHSDIRLIANRGFEVLDHVGEHLEAVAAESLYSRWDNVKGEYGDVPAGDREWLLGQLQRAQNDFDLDVIAIDYVPSDERGKAVSVATRIARHGFVPWVANPSLDHVGVGSIDVQPRKVMLLFDSRVNGDQSVSEVHRLLATPLEYLGYVPVYHDLHKDGMPPKHSGGRYAGVAFWSRGPQLTHDLESWMVQQMKDGLPVALLGTINLTAGSALLERAGLTTQAAPDLDTLQVGERSELIGFERDLPARVESLSTAFSNEYTDNEVHLSLEDNEGRSADIVVTGSWGGIAANPGVLDIDVDQTSHWITDPFEFLTRAFDLQHMPMPDVTSEGGKRLWFAHIDGDALPSWAEVPERKLGAEVLRDRILDRWPLPHTLSIVEAELNGVPAYADRRDRMMSVARDLFSRDYVEIATHTYSHPYDWSAVVGAPTSGTHNLPIGPYRYAPMREVFGSAQFINKHLAPAGKRTEMVLWSGNALPGEGALAAADAAGLLNMNGGVTVISKALPSISNVSPMARTVGKYTQVYAPIMNENVYTNEWTGPFDGFRRVIETFEMTERPRRLKPINVYYHYYIGTKMAGIRSLEDIYSWSMEQDIAPITASDYARRVETFRTAGVARLLDGRYRVSGLDSLTSLRVVGSGHALGSADSEHVQKARRVHDGLYLSVVPHKDVIVDLRERVQLSDSGS